MRAWKLASELLPLARRTSLFSWLEPRAGLRAHRSEPRGWHIYLSFGNFQ